MMPIHLQFRRLAWLVVLIPGTVLVTGPSAAYLPLAEMIREERWDAAEVECDRLIATDAENAEFRRLRSVVMEGQARVHYARGDFRRAAVYMERSGTERYTGVRRQMEARDWEGAQTAMDALAPAHRSEPAFQLLQAEIWIGAGEDSYRRGEYTRALECFEKALVLWPNHPGALARRAELRRGAPKIPKTDSPDPKPPGSGARPVSGVARQQRTGVRPAATRSVPPNTTAAPSPAASASAPPSVNIYIGDQETKELVSRVNATLRGSPAEDRKGSRDDPVPFWAYVLGAALLLVNVQLFIVIRRLRK